MTINLNKNLIPIAIIVAGVLVAGAFIYIKQGGGSISMQEAGEKAIAFINQSIQDQGVTASLIDVAEESGLYKIHLKIAETEYNSYITKDGKLLFASGFNLEEQLEEEAAATDNTAAAVEKKDRPDVKLFVMSFCPFGNQAEDTMLSVYNLLKDKVNWNIHYIVSVNNGAVSSLHGQPEVDQDEREVCVLRESGLDKWWQFTTYVNNNCGSDGSCWQDAAQSAGLNVSTIENCVSSKGLSLMTDEAAATDEDGVSGSPTLLINGTRTNSVYQYGNSQVYLDAICSGFTSPPEECSQQLTTEGNTSSGGGSCE